MENRSNKGFYSTRSTDNSLVRVIVARQIRQDASNTCNDVNICWRQQLHQLLQQTFHIVLQKQSQHIAIAANIWKRKVGMIYAAHSQGWVSSFCELFAKLIVATIYDLS